MKTLKEEIQEYQNILLNKDDLNYNNIQNFDISSKKQHKIENNKNNNEKVNIISSKEILKYNEEYKPIFDAILLRQKMQLKKNDIENKKSEKPYIEYVIDYKDKQEGKNNFNLDEEFNASSNCFNKISYSNKFHKDYSAFKPKSSSKYNNKYKPFEELKNKYFKEDINNLNIIEQEHLALRLKNMHNLINKNIDKNDELLSDKNKNIINKMNNEIKMIRNERNNENIIFENKIRTLENYILNGGNLDKIKIRINDAINIYSNNSKDKNRKKKTLSINKNKSYKKQRNVSAISINNKKIENKNNANIHRLNSSKINRKNFSINKNKNKAQHIDILKYLNKSNKKKNKKSKKKNKNINPSLLYCQKIINKINELNKENNKIEQKYKKMPISPDLLIEIVNSKNKNEKENISMTPDNYKSNKNKNKIKKNLKLISNKIIDDLLYDCLGELTYIEKQRTEKAAKERLKNKLNYTAINLEHLVEKEKNMLSYYKNKYNWTKNIVNGDKMKKFDINEMYHPERPKIIAKLKDDIIKRADEYQTFFMEYMILKGSFYSDFNIFDIYEIFIEELSQKIMEEEVDYIIKKSHFYVDKMCKDEIEEINK